MHDLKHDRTGQSARTRRAHGPASSDVLHGVPRRLGRRWSQRLCVSVRDATRRSPAGFARPVVPAQKAGPQAPTRGGVGRARGAVRTSALWRWTHRSRGHRIETCGRDYHYPKSPPPPLPGRARRAATCSCSPGSVTRHAPRSPQAARRGSRARRASRRYGFTVRDTHSHHARRSAEIARSDADAKPLSALTRSEAASL